MSPEDYAAAWLSEMWKPCPQRHQTDAEKAAAGARNEALDQSRGEPELPFIHRRTA